MQLITNPYFISIFYFVCALAFAFIINIIMLRFVATLGIRNNAQNGTLIRWSSQAKPSIGGIGFYIIFLFSFIVCIFFFNNNLFFLNKKPLGILLASSLGFIMGLYDDAYDTKPLLKLFSQIACGLILILTDTYIHIFENNLLNYLITILWIVGIMNAINLIDNMDGVATIISISIIIGILFMLCGFKGYKDPYLLILVGVFSSLLAFLWFNWHPSKMFMGDTGSQFLGAFLGATGIVYFWNAPFEDGVDFIFLDKILLAVLAFNVPIIDTTTVFIKRIWNKKSPFVGGKDHTSHHLSYLGLSDRNVAITLGIISLLSNILAWIIFIKAADWGFISAIIGVGWLLTVFGVLFYIANINIPSKN